MVKILRCLFLFALAAFVGTRVSAADVSDVNTIEELKGKAAGTYRFHFGGNVMIYGVYNDEYAGASLYLWDGAEGVRVTAQYDGAMKEIVDASPVGKALTGTVTAIWNPSSNDGCTLLVNTYRDERCSFDAVMGGELQLEPKPVTVSDISTALKDGYSADFAYVKMHGYTLYADYAKYMYDDDGERILIDNTCKAVPSEDFDMAFNNMTGTFTGGLIVTRVTDKVGTTVTPSLGVMTGNWFETDGKQETPEVELDADGTFDNSKGYPMADVTVRNLAFKAGVPAVVNMPFAMSAEHIRQNFGDGAKLYCMDSYKGNHVAADDEAVFDLYEFAYDASSTVAGSVYVVVPSKDAEELRFEGVTIVEWQQEGYHSFTDWDTYNKITLRGTFSKKGIDASKCMVYGEDGMLVVPQGEVKGFTGYFEAPASVIAGKGIRVVLNDNEEGTSCDTPFTAVVGGENVLPKAAGTYYYEVLPEKAGFITAVSEGRELAGGSVKVLGSCDEFDLITGSDNVFAVRFEVVPEENPRYIICVTKAADTASDEKFTVAAHDYAAGDSFDEPKEISAGSIAAPDYNGDYYYRLTVDAGINQFLTVNAADRAVSPDTYFLLYDAENPDVVLARDSEKKIDKYEVMPGKSYIIMLHDAESKSFDFSVMLEDVGYGETMSYSIPAVLGENQLLNNGYDIYYNYTPEEEGTLVVDVPTSAKVEFFDADGYAVAQKQEGTVYSTSAYVTAGAKYYIKFSDVTELATFRLSVGNSTGIGSVTAENGGVTVEDGRIAVDGNAHVVVYDMSGVKVAEGVGKDGFNVGSGTYIVNVDGKALKVAVR